MMRFLLFFLLLANTATAAETPATVTCVDSRGKPVVPADLPGSRQNPDLSSVTIEVPMPGGRTATVKAGDVMQGQDQPPCAERESPSK